MKYCEECKVYCHSGLTSCPLCGSHLEQRQPEEGMPKDYSVNIEPKVFYPKLIAKDDVYKHFLRKKMPLILVCLSLICIIINILVSPTVLWSGYVAVACCVIHFCIISTIYRKRQFFGQIAVCATTLSAAIIAMDMIQSLDRCGKLTLFGVSLEFIVPSLLLAAMILCDIMAFAQRHTSKYYLLSLLICSLCALLPQIVIWCVPSMIGWFSISVFFFAILNGMIMTIIHWKRIKSEFGKKFFV